MCTRLGANAHALGKRFESALESLGRTDESDPAAGLDILEDRLRERSPDLLLCEVVGAEVAPRGEVEDADATEAEDRVVARTLLRREAAASGAAGPDGDGGPAVALAGFCLTGSMFFVVQSVIFLFASSRLAGVAPLVVATGAGAGSQADIGTGVIGGMLTATILAIFFVPVFFVIVNKTLQRHA